MAPFETPISILKGAQNRVPSLKYAHALVGIAAAGAIIVSLLGKIGNPIVIISLIFIGTIAVYVLTIVVNSGFIGVKYAASMFIWIILVFIFAFLWFTVTAVYNGLPCGWAEIISVRPHKECGDPLPNDKIAPLELLENRVNSFTYMAREGAGTIERNWRRIAPDRWEETGPSNHRSIFKFVQRTQYGECFGNIISKLGNDDFQILIQDKNCFFSELKFRVLPGKTWNDIGAMQDIK